MLDLRPQASKEERPIETLGELGDPAEIPLKQQLQALSIDNARLSKEVNALTAEQQSLRAELNTAKAQLRDMNERACLKKIQKVLKKHDCSLTALPDGRCEIRQKN